VYLRASAVEIACLLDLARAITVHSDGHQPDTFIGLLPLAKAEGVALNQPINLTVAEELSALRTERYLRECAAHGDVAEGLRIIERAGVGRPPRQGDGRTEG
jgi:hypothetical protein